jgi:hypothetical protein
MSSRVIAPFRFASSMVALLTRLHQQTISSLGAALMSSEYV